MRTNRQIKLLALLVGGAVFGAVMVVTWPAAFRQLSLDDVSHLGTFPKINSQQSFWEVFRLRHWQYQNVDAMWRPTSKLLWWGLGRAGMLGSVWLTSLTALLAGVCAALFVLCLQSRFTPRWLVALAALLPLLHPLSADVLLPYVGQTDLLGAIGIIGAWAALVRPSGLRLVWGALFLALAFFSKESAWPGVLVLPVALWLGVGSRRQRLRASLWSLGLASGVLAFHFLLRFAFLGSFAKASGGAGNVFGFGERHVGAFETLGRYISAFVFARTPQTDYSFLKQPASSAGAYPWIGIAGTLALVLGVACFLRKTPASRANAQRLRARRQTAAGLLWMLTFLLPYLGFVTLGALWAGRFAFMSLFGFALLLASSVHLVRERYRWASVAVLAMLLLSGIGGIFVRAHDWVSPAQLWQAEVIRIPEHGFAWNNHSVCLQGQGQLGKAYEAICRSTELWPGFGNAWITRAQLASTCGNEADAERSFDRAEAAIPRSYYLHLTRAQWEISRKRFSEAQSRLNLILSEDPQNSLARKLLERIQSESDGRGNSAAP